MPSGAKKRKAAKKKLQKEAHNYFDGSHSLGTETTKSHDERESDGGEFERETSEEPVVNNHGDVKEEVSLSEQNVVELPKEEKLEENYNDVSVNNEGDNNVKKNENGGHKRSSSSSSSSSSEDDEVAVEKEKPVEVEVSSSLVEVEESIPVQECVKEVVSFPNELKNENENENESEVENLVVASVVESEMKQNLDEVMPSVDEKENVSLKVTNVVEEKMDTKVKEFETHKYVEEQPLISSSPLPVRRTSWTNCCGLFEVFSGGASR